MNETGPVIRVSVYFNPFAWSWLPYFDPCLEAGILELGWLFLDIEFAWIESGEELKKKLLGWINFLKYDGGGKK